MSEIRSLNERERYGYAVCGLGPAGIGFLLHAIKEGAVDQLVDRGLVLIDRSRTPGAGKVGDYRLTGNSLSKAFLDCSDDPKLAWLFDDLNVSATSIRQLRDRLHEAPPLDIVAEFLEVMATRTIAYLAREHQVPVLLGTSVEAIHQRSDGRFRLQLYRNDSGQKKTIDADNLLCGFGGRQAESVIGACEVRPGLRLGDHARNLFASDDVLMMSNDAIRSMASKNPASIQEAVVVGSSHSAMSTIDRLTEALGPVGLKRIVMLHREPMRLYYASPEEAAEDAYPFDEKADICPMSGRVNRFGGLRYRSFDVARSIIETGRTPDQTVEIVPVRLSEHSDESVARYLQGACMTVACLGYQANLPPVLDTRDREIPLQNSARGMEIDEQGRALTADGRPVPGLFVYGIGSRLLKRSDAIGGEPSFRGSADGVWLYHNHGGAVILDALQDTFSSKSRHLGTLKEPAPSHATEHPAEAEWRQAHARAVR